MGGYMGFHKKQKHYIMYAIHKFPIKTIGVTEILLSDDHEVLHVGEQDGQVMMWVKVRTSVGADLDHYKFRIIGTGEQFKPDEKNMHYIGTVQMKEGLVWHVFQELD
jgi:hypothetical protein